MKFDVLTLFPEMFKPLEESIIGRATKNNKIQINLVDIRDYSKDKHKKVDDTIYGGGAGMLIKPDVVYDAYKSVVTNKAKVIYLSPKGKTLCQDKVESLAKEEHLILLCGHYEGIDQRVIDKIAPEEISIGDYVLTGGEIPAMVLIDSVSRYVEGVLNNESINDESFSNGLLEYPQYTKPELFENMKVPEVLLSGHHKNIKRWRRNKSLELTYKNRPELLEKVDLTKEDKEYLENLKKEDNDGYIKIN
ncbi:MAG: tRNA (guanosine(37)-N1)-methyltransferase TrmD [Candidatus Scatovivens sp.]